jgi:hypothetical protein
VRHPSLAAADSKELIIISGDARNDSSKVYRELDIVFNNQNGKQRGAIVNKNGPYRAALVRKDVRVSSSITINAA